MLMAILPDQWNHGLERERERRGRRVMPRSVCRQVHSSLFSPIRVVRHTEHDGRMMYMKYIIHPLYIAADRGLPVCPVSSLTCRFCFAQRPAKLQKPTCFGWLDTRAAAAEVSGERWGACTGCERCGRR